MGIKITNKKSNMPKALKLMSSIKSYLFEEEFGECKLMKTSEIEALRKAANALGKASDRTCK
jgi:hypothetical protein